MEKRLANNHDLSVIDNFYVLNNHNHDSWANPILQSKV